MPSGIDRKLLMTKRNGYLGILRKEFRVSRTIAVSGAATCRYWRNVDATHSLISTLRCCGLLRNFTT